VDKEVWRVMALVDAEGLAGAGIGVVVFRRAHKIAVETDGPGVIPVGQVRGCAPMGNTGRSHIVELAGGFDNRGACIGREMVDPGGELAYGDLPCPIRVDRAQVE